MDAVKDGGQGCLGIFVTVALGADRDLAFYLTLCFACLFKLTFEGRSEQLLLSNSPSGT
jgi:hypothetical protein